MKRIRWNKALCILLCATLVCSEGVTGQAAVSKNSQCTVSTKAFVKASADTEEPSADPKETPKNHLLIRQRHRRQQESHLRSR